MLANVPGRIDQTNQIPLYRTLLLYFQLPKETNGQYSNPRCNPQDSGTEAKILEVFHRDSRKERLNSVHDAGT